MLFAAVRQWSSHTSGCRVLIGSKRAYFYYRCRLAQVNENFVLSMLRRPKRNSAVMRGIGHNAVTTCVVMDCDPLGSAIDLNAACAVMNPNVFARILPRD